jgi:hypothetical protein
MERTWWQSTRFVAVVALLLAAALGGFLTGYQVGYLSGYSEGMDERNARESLFPEGT